MARVSSGPFSQSHFAMIPDANINRSLFDRGCTLHTTLDAGNLVPIYLDDVLPGDTFKFDATLFGRLTTPIVPFMDQIYLDTFWFFVPNRLIWDNFEKFIAGPDDPDDTTEYLEPEVEAPRGTDSEGNQVNGWASQSLGDYFGVRTGIPGLKCSALPFRAYDLIWNEWFRDENFYEKDYIQKGDGPDDWNLYLKLHKRGKRKDYFTSALPFPQRGPGVELSLATSAPVYGNGKALGLTIGNQQGGLTNYNGEAIMVQNAYGKNIGADVAAAADPLTDLKAVGVTRDPSKSGLIADLTSATAITINSFRTAYQMQTLMEQLARTGNRYIELLRGVFSVTSPDQRLQRPELLGTSSCIMNMEVVPQTSSTNQTTPQGNLAGYGVFADTKPHWEKSFVEHGWIIGLACVRTNQAYQQGVPRNLLRRTRFDYYWPALAHLGEQAVYRKEIFAQGPDVLNSNGDPVDDEVFGYQERYAEYRYGVNKITGKMRSDDPQSLDYWHLAQNFETMPYLGADFIAENPPLDRVLAVADEPEIQLDCTFNVLSTRPMPAYSIPGLITHL